MGGGPSQAERAAQRELERRNQEQAALQNRYIELAATPDPLTERLRARDTAWLDWSEGRNGPMNVQNAPGIGPAISLYNNAKAGQTKERMGIGALRMGINGTNPNYASALKEQRQAHREQDAAGGLENAVRMREAEATGSIMPLAALQQNQRMGLASLTSGNAQNTLGLMAQFAGRPRQPSFWQTLLSSGLGAAGQVGAAYLGR